MKTHLPLYLLLTTFIVLAVAYSLVAPLGEAPDEVSHWAYVQYLIAHQRLPSPEGAVAGEAHQPPLYYLLGALATFWLPNQNFTIIVNPDWQLNGVAANNLLLHTQQEEFPYTGGALAWHWVRWLSVALGAITVWATHQIARQVFPDDNTLALLAAALVAFLPQFLFLSAVVNNDNLLITLAALSLLLFLRLPRDARPLHFVWLGIVLGLGILAKLQGVVIAAALAGTFFCQATWLHPIERIKRIALIAVSAAGVIAPWAIYNTIVFNDPLNLMRFMQSTPRTDPFTLNDWAIYATRMYWSFLGKFGGVTNIAMPTALYVALTALILIGGGGWVVIANDWRKRPPAPVTRYGIGAFALIGLLMALSHIRSMFSVLGMDQARQIFAGLPIFGTLIAAGILRLVPRQQTIVAALLASGLALIGGANLPVIAAAYAPVYLPANVFTATPATADFGQVIRLGAYQLDRSRALPGEAITIDLHWQALDDLDENYWLLLQLVGPKDVVANQDGVPAAGRLTTNWWRKGQAFASRHTLVVPADLPPGTYTLQLGLHPYGRWDWLPVRGEEMVRLAKIDVIRQ